MNWIRPLSRISRTLLFVVAPVCIVGAIFARSCSSPFPGKQERIEGLQVAQVLETMIKESERLSGEERACANKLTVLLDMVSSGQVERFKPDIDSALSRLSAVKDGREALRGKLAGLRLTAPLPQAVRDEVMYIFLQSRTRVESWIQLVQNLREREGLGKTQEFPEVGRLNRLLDLFLGFSEEDPVRRSIEKLRNEYAFSDREIGL